VIERAPSAELRPDHRRTRTRCRPYEVLDPILEAFYRGRLIGGRSVSAASIAQGGGAGARHGQARRNTSGGRHRLGCGVSRPRLRPRLALFRSPTAIDASARTGHQLFRLRLAASLLADSCFIDSLNIGSQIGEPELSIAILHDRQSLLLRRGTVVLIQDFLRTPRRRETRTALDIVARDVDLVFRPVGCADKSGAAAHRGRSRSLGYCVTTVLKAVIAFKASVGGRLAYPPQRSARSSTAGARSRSSPSCTARSHCAGESGSRAGTDPPRRPRCPSHPCGSRRRSGRGAPGVLLGEREARGQRLILLDGILEVVGEQRFVRSRVQRLRRHRWLLASGPGVATGQQRQRLMNTTASSCQRPRVALVFELKNGP